MITILEAMQNGLTLLEANGFRDGDVHDDLASTIRDLHFRRRPRYALAIIHKVIENALALLEANEFRSGPVHDDLALALIYLRTTPGRQYPLRSFRNQWSIKPYLC